MTRIAHVARILLGLPVLTAWPAHHARAATLLLADGPSRCAPAPGTQSEWTEIDNGDTCRVVAFGEVPGSKPPLFYQLQAYLAAGQAPGTVTAEGQLVVGGPGNDGAGAVLLLPAPDRRTLTVIQGWSGGSAVITAPRLVHTPQGPVAVMAMSADVSSHPTDDVVFRVLNGRWVQVETDGWFRGIRVPRGLAQWHGNAMDWPRLRTFGAFWRPHDAECCPTGGSYIAQLRLDGRHLRLGSVRISRGELPFP